MIKVGLTGNIGSGKTFVSRIFEALKIAVFNADLQARNILNSPEMLDRIKDVFGKEFVLKNAEVDRKLLAGVVFNSAKELEKLNHLIHPVLMDTFNNWSEEKAEDKYVILEAAILFENKFSQYVDKTICVSAPFNLRMERVIKRDGGKKEDILARMKNQWPDGKKEDLSDFVIKNDGAKMLLPQILKIHQELIS
jgi:dephospho-CoA kinase